MRSHHVHHHRHHVLAHASRHVGHVLPAGPGGAWYVRAVESLSFSHFSVGWLLGGAGYLLGRLWLPAVLVAAGALGVLVARVWGRHRLAAAGSSWELHVGEQVSRAAVESLMSTLAGGLPRKWFGASPWVALSVSSLEDRVRCGVFISGGLPPAQVRASIEQGLGGVTAEKVALDLLDMRRQVRVASLSPGGSRFLPLRVDHRVDHPTGELTALTLARIPIERTGDVDVLDLGDAGYPPALNLLACTPGEGDAHAQAICGIFARLFSRFWGPRTEDILRSALTTLLCGRDLAGPAPTLADVLTLLSDPGERARYRAGDPVALDVFWRQWQTLSEQARVQALAPLSNKLRALLGNRQLRNMLCQPTAPDLTERISGGRWLLVSLPQTLGEDAADLIGSVLLHRAWQAAQRLGPLALADRPPFLCVVDECHRFCHLPQGMANALAQARGYGVGMVLAHQNLAQLKDSELAETVDANCQTKVCFGLGAADAKRMAVHFEPRLDAHDLLHLVHIQLPAASLTSITSYPLRLRPQSHRRCPRAAIQPA
jgi:hypothetical protein